MVLSSLCGKVIHSTHIMTPICSSPSKLIMTWKNLVNKWWGLYRTKMHVPSYLGYMSLFCRACSDAASDSHTMRLIFILKPQRNGFTFGSFSLPFLLSYKLEDSSSSKLWRANHAARLIRTPKIKAGVVLRRFRWVILTNNW